MAETMNGLKRTSYCGKLSKANVGKEEVVCGWVQKQRDKGHLVFIDLRDRTGVVQLVFDDNTDREVFEKAASVHAEYVLIAKGMVREREAVNTEISTGEIELFVTELRILSKAQTPPFEITDKSKVKEELRLKYRFRSCKQPLQACQGHRSSCTGQRRPAAPHAQRRHARAENADGAGAPVGCSARLPRRRGYMGCRQALRNDRRRRARGKRH